MRMMRKFDGDGANSITKCLMERKALDVHQSPKLIHTGCLQ